MDLARLADRLPDLVANAVDCPEEPWLGAPGPGDIQIRFHPKGAQDIGQLRLVIEVRTKLLASRIADKRRRADLVRDGPSDLGFESVGVWLLLEEGAWSQSSASDVQRAT
jgi:hypothetical protein